MPKIIPDKVSNDVKYMEKLIRLYPEKLMILKNRGHLYENYAFNSQGYGSSVPLL